MAIKIGIPRALLYYEYYPLWKTFFEELGAEVVLSDKTTKDILNEGSEVCVNDACLPIKIFHGHVINLLGKVDLLFIPRLRSVYKKEYICPKFGGLPEMVKHAIPDLPPIIDTEVYLRKSNSSLKGSFIDAAKWLTNDSSLINRAYKKAFSVHNGYQSFISQGRTPTELLEGYKIKRETKRLNIAVIGHVYNVYDNYVNMNIFKKLSEQEIGIITPEMLNQNLINNYAGILPKKTFWTFGRRLLGTALHFINNGNIDGIIYISAFGCGIDSFIADLIERRIRRESEIPFFLMTIDEHSGEAGIDTRLEAFIDMIYWRKNNASYLPAYR